MPITAVWLAAALIVAVVVCIERRRARSGRKSPSGE